jgi:hypothetical protein
MNETLEPHYVRVEIRQVRDRGSDRCIIDRQDGLRLPRVALALAETAHARQRLEDRGGDQLL